jgi:hypothetical protein
MPHHRSRDIATDPSLILKFRALQSAVGSDTALIPLIDFPYVVGQMPEILTSQPLPPTKGPIFFEYPYKDGQFIPNEKQCDAPLHARYQDLLSPLIPHILRTERMMGTPLEGASIKFLLNIQSTVTEPPGVLHFDGNTERPRDLLQTERYYITVNTNPTFFWAEADVWDRIKKAKLPISEGFEWMSLPYFCKAQDKITFKSGDVVVFGPKTPHSRPSTPPPETPGQSRVLLRACLRLPNRPSA